MKLDEQGAATSCSPIAAIAACCPLIQDDVTSKARGSVATLAESPARCVLKMQLFFSGK